VRILFFFILLVNITFFLWEYRKGAPDIYFPKAHLQLQQNNLQGIVLLSELPDVNQPERIELLTASSDKFDRIQVKISEITKILKEEEQGFPGLHKKENTLSIKQAISNKPSWRVSACYVLKDSVLKAELLTIIKGRKDYESNFYQQDQSYVSSYLVLTHAVNSLKKAKAIVASLREQGINDYWLFKKGSFKWRISLGLFRKKSKAIKVVKQYQKKIKQALEVVPSHQTKKVINVKLRTQSIEAIAIFESQFAYYIDKESHCD